MRVREFRVKIWKNGAQRQHAIQRAPGGDALFFFDERLRFDDRVFFRKRVKRRQEQATGARFRRHVSQGRYGEPMVGLEVVQQSALGPVGEDFLVDVQKDFRRQRFDLEIHLVSYPVTAGHARGVFAAQSVAERTAIFGKGAIDIGQFGQQAIGVFPGDKVSGAGDMDGDLIIGAFDAAHSQDIEKLRMQRSFVELKDQVGYPGPDGKNAHDAGTVPEKKNGWSLWAIIDGRSRGHNADLASKDKGTRRQGFAAPTDVWFLTRGSGGAQKKGENCVLPSSVPYIPLIELAGRALPQAPDVNALSVKPI
jgi:hypothetical protein